IVVSSNAFNFSELADLSRSLNILEHNIWVVGQVDNTLKIVIKTLRCLEFFKQLNKVQWTNQIRVFGGDLDNNLQILTNIHTEHFVKRFECLFNSKLAKVIDEPFWVENV